MYRFAWFRGFEASDADTQTSSGRGAAPSPFKRWFGEAAVQPYDTLLLEAAASRRDGRRTVTFRQLRELRRTSLRLTATSITHQRVTYFDVVATPDLAIARAVRASSAVPLLFAPVEIGELSRVYEYGAAGLGFDVTRADKQDDRGGPRRRGSTSRPRADGGLFEDRRPWEPRDPLDLDDRDDAT
ncbi:patatin-like phospholipase [Aureococcus anophagefferens]|nr:patatin-like phospholipase [Aureococcus anophagefferens]